MSALRFLETKRSRLSFVHPYAKYWRRLSLRYHLGLSPIYSLFLFFFQLSHYSKLECMLLAQKLAISSLSTMQACLAIMNLSLSENGFTEKICEYMKTICSLGGAIILCTSGAISDLKLGGDETCLTQGTVRMRHILKPEFNGY